MSHSILSCAQQLKIEKINNGQPNNNVVLNDNGAIVSFTDSAVFVSMPANEYSDFQTSCEIWNHLEQIFNTIRINPIVWSFTKGNLWVFNKPIADKNPEDIYRVILSNDFLKQTTDKHFFACESDDKTCVVTCRYGIGKTGIKDSLTLKIMIATQSYTINNICEQVLDINNLMFDIWHWAVSSEMKKFMSKMP